MLVICLVARNQDVGSHVCVPTSILETSLLSSQATVSLLLWKRIGSLTENHTFFYLWRTENILVARWRNQATTHPLLPSNSVYSVHFCLVYCTCGSSIQWSKKGKWAKEQSCSTCLTTRWPISVTPAPKAKKRCWVAKQVPFFFKKKINVY